MAMQQLSSKPRTVQARRQSPRRLSSKANRHGTAVATADPKIFIGSLTCSKTPEQEEGGPYLGNSGSQLPSRFFGRYQVEQPLQAWRWDASSHCRISAHRVRSRCPSRTVSTMYPPVTTAPRRLDPSSPPATTPHPSNSSVRSQPLHLFIPSFHHILCCLVQAQTYLRGAASATSLASPPLCLQTPHEPSH